MIITLYDATRCPFCARVRIALVEKQIAVETVLIDLDNRPDWIRKKNPPSGRVPVIDVGELTLPESVVICEYLEEIFPETPLLPSDPAARALVRLHVERFDDLGDAYSAARRREEGGREELIDELASLDGLLESKLWLTGDAFGLADVAYVPWVLRARDLLGIDLAGVPHVADWVERLSERPSIQQELAVIAGLPRLV
jgi:glutathione S-transferase